MIVGLYGVSLCLLMPSVLCIDGFGELGEHFTFAFMVVTVVCLDYLVLDHSVGLSGKYLSTLQ